MFFFPFLKQTLAPLIKIVKVLGPTEHGSITRKALDLVVKSVAVAVGEDH